MLLLDQLGNGNRLPLVLLRWLWDLKLLQRLQSHVEDSCFPTILSDVIHLRKCWRIWLSWLWLDYFTGQHYVNLGYIVMEGRV